jgi:hypothetical protein
MLPDCPLHDFLKLEEGGLGYPGERLVAFGLGFL